MSRSALWRQEASTQDRQRRADETFSAAIAEGRSRHVKGQIPLVGPDDTFNIHPMLLQNIAKSPYFQKCCDKLVDWNMVVDEIYYEVKHLEPWTAAFCLLLRLFTLRLTTNQMSIMLSHPDSPYIRCLGLLYLRYAADPSTLWAWYTPYLYDNEPVQIRQGKADSTVGEYSRMLLENLEYFGTRLPRLPLTLEREIKVKLLQAERIEERATLHLKNSAAMEYFKKVGSRIQALYGDEENPVTWYDAVVDRVILREEESGELLDRPRFQVTFVGYGNTEVVGLGEVDLPGSHGVDGGNVEKGGERRVGRGYDDYNRGYDGRGRGYDRDVGRDRGRDHDYRHDDPRRDRSRSRDRPPFNPTNAASRNKSREQEERELMDEVLRREREKSAAKGRAYAAVPAGFRGVNADDNVGGRHDIQDKWAPPPKAKYDKGGGSSPPPPAPVVKKTAAELAAIEEKKRKLAARYG